MNKSRLQFLSLFLISVALIAFELDIIRVFAVGNWTIFGSMIISIALLGNGIAGSLLTFLQKKVRRNADDWIAFSALALVPTIGIAYTLAQHVPFNPLFLVSQPVQFFWIGFFYFLYAVPFFAGALFIGIVFMTITERVHKLYFWNMAGSGAGGLVLLILMYLMPVRRLVSVILLFAAAGALLVQYRTVDGPGERIKPVYRRIILCAVFGVMSFLLLGFFGDIRKNEYKATELAKVTFSDLELKYSGYSPLGESEVYRSSKYHFAPGLSDNAVFYIDEMPRDAFWGLYIDGDGPINIMRALNGEETRYIDFLPMSAPYTVLDKPDVLLVRLGGGFSAFTALHHGAKKITVVEPNPDIVKIVRDVQAVRDFTGDLLRNPAVTLVQDEPRAFCSSGGAVYDLVEISLIDSIGLSQSVGNPVGENYLYTVEAVRNYLRSLNDDGILAITTWNHLAPPRNVPRLLTTVVQALKDEGAEDIARRIYGFHLIYSTATILVKNSPFTPGEIEKLNAFCYRMSFEPFYYPGMPSKELDFTEFLYGYLRKYGMEIGNPEFDKTIRHNPGDLYHFTITSLLEGGEKDLYAKYIFDIKPTTDDRPYYSVYLKPSTMGLFLDELKYISEEWGYLLILGTLVQALFFAVLIILIPLFGGLKRRGESRKGTAGVILYYSGLGAGYMLVEIYLIQKLVFFLSNPIYSASIVIMTMLIVSGIGSLTARRFAEKPARLVRGAVLILAGVLVLYMFVLPLLLKALLGLPFTLKALLAVVFIVPAAFLMGMPFPTGLANLSANRPVLLPWAWGMNGALSVTGSVLASVIAVNWGFFFVLLAAILCYLLSAAVFTVNTRGA